MSSLGCQYILGLGSNLGKKEEYIHKALKAIELIPKTKLLEVSLAVDSDPVGYADQPNFLNLCCLIVSEIKAPELLTHTLAIESQLGRVRGPEKNGPRCIDIDLLFKEDGPFTSANLTLPHPRWSSRNFVTVPLRHLLQTPSLASNSHWTWLKQELAQLPDSQDGLRAWNGPTPWSNPTT